MLLFFLVFATTLALLLPPSNKFQVGAAATVEQIHLGPGVKVNDVNVGWVTPYSACQSGAVHFGRSPLALFSVSNATSTTFLDGAGYRNVTTWLATMNGLAADSTYWYRVVTPACGESDTFSFKTLPQVGALPSSGPLGFILFGDMGAYNSQSLPAVIQDVQTGQWHLGIGVGDYAYNMNDNNGTRADEYFCALQPAYAQLPFITTPGNHEYADNFQHYTYRWNTNPVNTGVLPAAAGGSVAGQPNNWYFSYNAGLVHFVSIDSEIWFDYSTSLLEPMLTWLDQDLAAAQRNRKVTPWVVVFAHRPIYCSCDADCDGAAKTVRQDLEPLLLKHGVDLLINAHEHNYERLYAMANSTYVAGAGEVVQNPGASVMIITGDAGNTEGHEPFTRPQPKWSAFRSNTFGYSRMLVHNSSHLFWEQVMTDSGEKPEDYGKIIDRMWLIQDHHGPFQPTAAAAAAPSASPFSPALHNPPHSQYMSRMTGRDGPGHKAAQQSKKNHNDY